MAYYDRNIVNETTPGIRTNYTEKLTLLPKGYTARGKINGFPVMMTNFSLSYGMNIVKGNGVMPVYQKKKFERIQGNAFRDYPEQSLSLVCEATEGIFTKVIIPAFKDLFLSSFDVVVEDSANGIKYHFEEAWVNKCEFRVDSEAAVSVSFEFSIYRESFDVESSKRTTDDYAYEIENTKAFIKDFVGNKLLGYYHFGVQYSDFTDQPLMSFGIDFSREITPKFGCVGKKVSQESAIDPMKLIFGLPQVSYSLTYLMVDDIYNDDYKEQKDSSLLNESNRIVLNPVNDDGKTLKIYFIDKPFLEFTNCYPNSYSPQVGNKEDVPRIEVSGEVYGKIKVNEF